MGLLQRITRQRGPQFWEAEGRLLHRLGFVRPPVAVQWISTSVCDLTCPHCYSRAGRRTAGELTTDEAKRRVIDEFVALDRPEFVIAGGEPLLRPDFAEVVRYAHRRGVPWSLHSHGGRVERHLDVFAECRPRMVALSLDGPREMHDRFRGRAGAFDAVLRSIAALKRVGVREVVAGTTVHRDNADLLGDMVPTILASRADSWGLHLVTPEGRAGEHPALLPSADQLRRVASFARRMRSIFRVELDNEWGSAGEDDCFYRDSPFMCGAGRFVCVVSATGEVVPCTTTDPSESAGNVRSRRLRDIWADGFGAFRGRGDPLRSASHDCWLQTRHGCSARGAAFGRRGGAATLSEPGPQGSGLSSPGDSAARTRAARLNVLTNGGRQ